MGSIIIMDTTIKSRYAQGSSTYRDAATGDIDRKIADMPKNIPGWGVDADPANDPTYPMKNRNGADYERMNYLKPVQQSQTVDIFKSIERPTMTRVFGTSTPPRGLSGLIRRFAFRFSEDDARHWLTLIFADRIDVVEGIIDDLKQGTIPNIFLERGWRAEWKYNRVGLIKRIAVTTAVSAAIITLLIYRRRSQKRLSLLDP